jgi:hypothetical protein
MVSIPDFGTLLRNGATSKHILGDVVTVEQHELGMLNLPSGEIIACDPFICGVEPFEVRVKPGRYPVFIGTAQRDLGDEVDSIVAYALLRFNDEIPVQWQIATWLGDDLSSEGEIFGYGVDMATGCFMDGTAVQVLEAEFSANGINYMSYLDNQLEKNGRMWADVTLDQATDLNVILFTSGFGDGVYASYWGYTANGQIACLVTDFGVLEPSVEL